MKKLISLVFALVLTAGMASVAFAAESPIAPASDGKSFNFTCQTSGGSESMASAAYKNDTTQADLGSLKSSDVSSTNQISFRIRKSSNDASVSSLYTRSNTTGFSIYYTSGNAVPGNYKLWASAPTTNAKTSVSMSGTFYP